MDLIITCQRMAESYLVVNGALTCKSYEKA